MLPGDILGGQCGAVGGEHSHAVTGVVNAGSYVIAVMCFWLKLVSLFILKRWLARGTATSPRGGGKPYHILYGDFSPGFAVVLVRFRTWHAQDIASAHKDG